MKKRFLQSLAVIAITIVILWSSLVIITFAFSSKIKLLAISELNKRLNTEVKVNGEIDFSLLSHFPSCTISFGNVVVKETHPQKNDLLNCQKISLLFSIWNLFRSNYVINKIIAENGAISINVDSAGNNNYQIFKTDNSSSAEFNLMLSEAVLKNFLVQYHNESTQQYYSLQTGDTRLQGNFTATKFSLTIRGDAFSNYLRSGNLDFLPQRKIKLNGTIDCDLTKQLYILRGAGFSVNGNEFSISGSITSVEQGNDLQLKISSGVLRLEDIISLLPAEYTKKLSDFSSNGSFDFKCDISGLQSALSSARVNATFKLHDVAISNAKVKQAIQHLNVEGNFTNGDSHNLNTSAIGFNRFDCTIDGNPIKGTFNLNNFKQPFLDVVLNGSIELSKIYPLLHDSSVKSIEGIVNMHQCFFRGSLAQLSSRTTLNKINAGGKFELHDVKIAAAQRTYDQLNGIFVIHDNEIRLSDCAFRARQSDLRFEGEVSNFFPFLYSVFNASQVKQKVGVNAQLVSHHLNWEDLVGNSSAPSDNDDYAIPEIFYWLSGAVSGRVDEFRYQRFSATGIQGNFLFLPDHIYFNNIGFRAENGMVTGSGNLDISNSQHSKLELTTRLDQLDISRLFYEFNDFGQATLTHNHLKGKVTAGISLQSTWDDNRLNKSKLQAIADVSIEDGELNNFEPMLALSTFLKLKELQHIRFSKMENQLEIRNQEILIPAMQIYSSALNVQLSGSHGFNNMIDYELQLNLLKLLTDKFRKQKTNEAVANQSTEGFLNLYLTMTGPAANPVIKYDKKSVKQKIATDLASEKNSLKDALAKEFNLQSASQNEAKDFKPEDNIQYFEFEDSLNNEAERADENRKAESTTKQNQKQAVNDFKNIFKKPPK
ncbi:MAG: AsmA-like C-terminal region-containing protein [Chitinophagales bacterium]